MIALDLRNDVCQTESIEDDCGFKLVNVCHDVPRSLGWGDTYICTDDLGVRCEQISAVSEVDQCGCEC